MATTIRTGFVKFSLDGYVERKLKYRCTIYEKEHSNGFQRAIKTIPTMCENTRTSFVKFPGDGHKGENLNFNTLDGKDKDICSIKPSTLSEHVVRARPKVGAKRRKSKKRTPIRTTANRMCACGDIYCNFVTKFLGKVITEKCSYVHPGKVNKNRNKQLRAEEIYMQLVRFRETRNEMFSMKIPTAPPKNARFNEIHYPMLFLREYEGSQKIPQSIDVELAKRSKMFKDNLVGYYKHFRKKRVAVVPSLNTHQAIQVLILYFDEHTYL